MAEIQLKPTEETSPEPKTTNAWADTKFHSMNSILVGTFLGSPLVAGILVRKNLIAQGRKAEGKQWLLWCTVGTIALFAGLIALPEAVLDKLPNYAIPFVYTAIVGLAAEKSQGKFLKKHKEADGPFYSVWRAVGTSLLCALGIVVVIGSIALAIFGFE